MFINNVVRRLSSRETGDRLPVDQRRGRLLVGQARGSDNTPMGRTSGDGEIMELATTAAHASSRFKPADDGNFTEVEMFRDNLLGNAGIPRAVYPKQMKSRSLYYILRLFTVNKRF